MLNTDIAICTPYWERSEHLRHTLESYEKMGYFDKEKMQGLTVGVSICDDGSVKDPAPTQRTNPYIETVYLPREVDNQGRWLDPCVPINAAVRSTSAPLIVLTEPEVYHVEPVLLEMSQMMTSEKDVIVCPCRVTGQRGHEWYAHPVHKPRHSWWFWMQSRELFEAMGGWDESYRWGIGWDDDDTLEAERELGAQYKWLTDKHVVHPYMPKKPMYKGKYANNQRVFEEKWGIKRKDMADV